jgi:hypothetical protein
MTRAQYRGKGIQSAVLRGQGLMIQAARVVGDSVQKLRLLGFRGIGVEKVCGEIMSRYEEAALTCLKKFTHGVASKHAQQGARAISVPSERQI